MIDLEKQLLYEDNHIIIFNKSAGLLVQGDATQDTPLVDLCKSYLKEKYNKPGNVFCGVVHRLDRPTSGCIILAKTSKGLSRMSKLFKDRSIKKVYWALTSHKKIPPEGTLTHYIEKYSDKNKVKCHTHERDGAKKAILNYQVIADFGDKLLFEIDLKTGRKHQIRAQLKTLQCSIVGDLKYGYAMPNLDKSICLHCRSMIFIHPVSKEQIRVECLPPDIAEWNEVKYWAKNASKKSLKKT